MAIAKLKVNYGRAKWIFNTLLAHLETKRFPYNVAQVPHTDENFPQGMPLGGVEEALFLFISCLWMRGGIKSITAFRRLAKAYEKRPEFFDPAHIATWHDPMEAAVEISELLKSCGLDYRAKNPQNAPREWVFNLLKLHRHWQGDPRNLFRGEDITMAQACARITSVNGQKGGKFDLDNPHGFLSFREKMVSMIFFFLSDRGLIDDTCFPIPVDFHVMRLLVACRIVELPEDWTGYESDWQRLADRAREISQKYCTEEGKDWRRLCDALWLLSGNVCNEHPGNMSIVGEYAARSTTVDPVEFTWDRQRVTKYLHTCGCCPIESECTYCIPSAYYYRQGRLVVRGERAKPTGLLF